MPADIGRDVDIARVIAFVGFLVRVSRINLDDELVGLPTRLRRQQYLYRSDGRGFIRLQRERA
jgi:hypothetical protein